MLRSIDLRVKITYIEVGSSTVKVYISQDKEIILKETKSLPFKKEIDMETGLSESLKGVLIEYINDVQNDIKLIAIRFLQLPYFVL